MYRRARYIFFVPEGYKFIDKYDGNKTKVVDRCLTLCADPDTDALVFAPFYEVFSIWNKGPRGLVGGWEDMKVMRQWRQEHYEETGAWVQIRRVSECMEFVNDKDY